MRKFKAQTGAFHKKRVFVMTEDRRPGSDSAERTPEESRQAEIGRDRFVRGPMRYVLIISTILAVGALVVAYMAS